MADDRINSSTGVTEGLPPTSPVHGDDEPAEPNLRVNETTAMELFAVWERLRLLHNGVFWLGLYVRNGPSAFWNNFTLYELFLIAATVNACFCAGPIAECYLTWFGFPRGLSRWMVFGIGTLVVVLFALELISLPAPGPGNRRNI